MPAGRAQVRRPGRSAYARPEVGERGADRVVAPALEPDRGARVEQRRVPRVAVARGRCRRRRRRSATGGSRLPRRLGVSATASTRGSTERGHARPSKRGSPRGPSRGSRRVGSSARVRCSARQRSARGLATGPPHCGQLLGAAGSCERSRPRRRAGRRSPGSVSPSARSRRPSRSVRRRCRRSSDCGRGARLLGALCSRSRSGAATQELLGQYGCSRIHLRWAARRCFGTLPRPVVRRGGAPISAVQSRSASQDRLVTPAARSARVRHRLVPGLVGTRPVPAPARARRSRTGGRHSS